MIENKLYLNQIQRHPENRVPSPIVKVNLEKCLQGIEFKKKTNNTILDKIISDKAKVNKSTVNALLDEIELRENLNTRLIEKIDTEVSNQNRKIINTINRKDHYDFERLQAKNQMISNLENRVLELEKEKRQESLECWRDLMFLKKYLLSALKNYWDLIKRREVLGNTLN